MSFQYNYHLMLPSIILHINSEPSAPLDLNLNPLRPTILHVTWTTPVGSPNRITSYNVLIKNLKDDSKSRVQVKDFHASGAQSHLLRGLNPGAVYQIEVRPSLPEN